MSQVVEGAARIDEGMARHRSSPSEGQAALSSILGISFDRALENKGETFCAAVVKIKGLSALNKVWDAPDNLPSSEEIKDPFQWMERVLEVARSGSDGKDLALNVAIVDPQAAPST